MDIKYMDAWVEGNSICFVNATNNEVLRWNLVGNKIYHEGLIESKKNNLVVRRIIKNKQDIFMIDNTGCTLYKYNVEERIAQRIFEEEVNGIRIKDAFLVDGMIFFVLSDMSQDIICYDIDKKIFYRKKNILKKCQMLNPSLENTAFSTVKVIKGKMYFTIINHNQFFEYDMGDESLLCLGTFPANLDGFDGDGENFWIAYSKGYHIIKWKKEDGIEGEYKLCSPTKEQDEDTHLRVIKCRDRIVILPRLSNTIAFLNEEKKCISIINTDKRLKHKKNNEKSVYSIGNILIEDTLILMPWGTDQTIIIDLNTMVGTVYEVELDESVKNFNLLCQIDRNEIIYETDFLNLENFLEIATK